MPLTIDNETVECIAKIFDKAKKTVIISHMNPDGDAVGSSLALYHWLNDAFFAGRDKPQIYVVLPHRCPADMLYLPGSNEILDAETDANTCNNVLREAELIIAVDLNNAPRVLPLDKALSESKAIKILIDHHHNPDTDLFHHIVSIPDLSSTCELLYWIFVQIIGDSSITDNTAQCLYHGINTDTGCFAYANEDATLYEATAALMKHPLNAADVHNRIFNNYSIRKMKLLGYLLDKHLRIFREAGFAYIYIDDKELADFGAETYDLEGLVNYTLMMEEMQVGALVKMSEGKVRISFRAKNDFDVNVFANKYFGGGGHTKASGATSPYDFNTTIHILEENMLNEIKAHNKK
ncbi:MAG: bifunctional oligoribonuclease/PAP phosphatase NrnA [Bacteroidales bacterium]|nr:bifunctional oligoribonuclease/PAP phosphatase NrnA [Bacteroidales bacterium]